MKISKAVSVLAIFFILPTMTVDARLPEDVYHEYCIDPETKLFDDLLEFGISAVEQSRNIEYENSDTEAFMVSLLASSKAQLSLIELLCAFYKRLDSIEERIDDLETVFPREP